MDNKAQSILERVKARSEAESSSLAASQALQGDRSPGGSPDKNSAPSQSSESSGVLGTMYGMLVGSGSNADLSKAPMTVNVTAPPPPPPSVAPSSQVPSASYTEEKIVRREVASYASTSSGSSSSSSSMAGGGNAPVKSYGLPILTPCPPPESTADCPVIMPDMVVPREGIYVNGLGMSGDYDHQNAKCFSDPVYGMAEANGFMQQVHGMGAPTFAANEGFGYSSGAGSGYGLAGPVGNVGFGPYSVYGGYYNGYVPNVPPPPMQSYPQGLPLPYPGTSGVFVHHPVYASKYGHAPFNYYHFDEETQQYVGAYVTQVHIGKGF